MNSQYNLIANAKSLILENQLRLYQVVMSKFTRKEIGIEGASHLPNPFKHKDKHHSFSIHNKAGLYYYCEFGDGTYSGDIFSFLSRYFNLDIVKDFKTICKNALELINIFPIENEKLVPTRQVTPIVQNYQNKTPIQKQSFTKADIEFWEQSAIDIKTVVKFGVSSIKSIKTKNSYFLSSDSNPIFAYKHNDVCLKIYQPKNKQYKWFWLGKKTDVYVFGFEQLPVSGELLLIAAGERDTLCLAAHGYNAICFNSETANIPEDIISSLKVRFKNIALIYDTDDTGLNRATILSDELNLDLIRLDAILPKNLGKDVCDYYKAIKNQEILDKNGLDSLIKDYLMRQQSNLTSSDLDEEENVNSDEEYHNVESVPDCVYENLPPLLNECVEGVNLTHEKEIILFSCIVAMAAPLYNYKIYYDKKYNYPNLFLQIIAPPASGKGNTYHSRHMLEALHKYFMQIQKQKILSNTPSDDKQSAAANMLPGILYPDRSTEPAIAQLMSNSLGATGVIYANELDSLSNARKSEHGDLSVIIRESFQNETYMKSLKTDSIQIEIKNCKVSGIFTGTFDQLKRYIVSVENGVASRFITIFPTSTTTFKNVLQRPTDESDDWEVKYQKIGEKLLALIKEIDMEQNEYIFIPSGEQAIKFTNHFQNMLDYAYEWQHTEAISNVFRVALMSAKIMMLYAFLLQSKEGTFYYLADNYFDSVLYLSNYIFNQSLRLLQYMKSNDVLSIKTPDIKQLYNSLPQNFSTKLALIQGKKLGLKERTIRRYIKDRDLFNNISHGEYIKRVIIEKPEFSSVLSA